MKLAIIGSRSLIVENIDQYIPSNVAEIISGGAKGVDRQAADYARKTGKTLTEFLPNYKRYGHAAPLKRNELIAEYADEAIAFWDGESRGTLHAIRQFDERGKHVYVIILQN